MQDLGHTMEKIRENVNIIFPKGVKGNSELIGALMARISAKIDETPIENRNEKAQEYLELVKQFHDLEPQKQAAIRKGVNKLRKLVKTTLDESKHQALLQQALGTVFIQTDSFDNNLSLAIHHLQSNHPAGAIAGASRG